MTSKYIALIRRMKQVLFS